MRNLILIIIALLFINSCCKKVDPVTYCNVENPLVELEWLQEMYDPNQFSTDTNSPMYYNSILLKQYFDGSEYIEFNLAHIFSVVMYDCAGNLICDYPQGCDILLSSKALKSFKTIAPIH